MVRFGVGTFTWVVVSSAALAGQLGPTPIPLAGITGPIGLAITGAAYVGYRAYKHYILKR